LRRGLLLHAEHAIPVDGFIEDAHDLLATHDGALHRFGIGRRGRVGRARHIEEGADDEQQRRGSQPWHPRIVPQVLRPPLSEPKLGQRRPEVAARNRRYRTTIPRGRWATPRSHPGCRAGKREPFLRATRMSRQRTLTRHFRTGPILLAASACCSALLSGCAGSGGAREPAIDPDVARAQIARALPDKLGNRDGWAVDIFAALEALHVPPTMENACAVIAVGEQESSLQVDPQVPGLPAIARREIEARAASHHIPMLVVDAALALDSPTGASY